MMKSADVNMCGCRQILTPPFVVIIAVELVW